MWTIFPIVFIEFAKTTASVLCFGFLAMRHVGSQLPNQGSNPYPPCIRRQSLNHQTTREVPKNKFLCWELLSFQLKFMGKSKGWQTSVKGKRVKTGANVVSVTTTHLSHYSKRGYITEKGAAANKTLFTKSGGRLNLACILKIDMGSKISSMYCQQRW